MNDVFTINNRSFNINTIETNLQTGESNIELLNNFSVQSLALTNVYTLSPLTFYTFYYNSSIGNAQNLTVGNIIYTNIELSTIASADTYYQDNSGETTTHCNASGEIMSMTVNSSGAITAISCSMP